MKCGSTTFFGLQLLLILLIDTWGINKVAMDHLILFVGLKLQFPQCHYTAICGWGRGAGVVFFDTTRRTVQHESSRHDGGVSNVVPSPKCHTTFNINRTQET